MHSRDTHAEFSRLTFGTARNLSKFMLLMVSVDAFKLVAAIIIGLIPLSEYVLGSSIVVVFCIQKPSQNLLSIGFFIV